jgi:hypothetical protein
MPAKLTRRVVRETAAQVYSRGESRAVVVELEAGGSLAWLRLKGMRSKYPLTYGELYTHAVRIFVDAEKRRKAKERAESRKTALRI